MEAQLANLTPIMMQRRQDSLTRTALIGPMPHLPLSAATVYAGYRYQAISTDFEEQGFQGVQT